MQAIKHEVPDPVLLAGKRIVAGISGGKDSGAMSLWLHECGIEHERIFNDTGWEHAATYDYIRGPLTDAIGPITELQPKLQMVDLIRRKGMFPSRFARYCTEALKIEPMHRHFASLGTVLPIVSAIGIRAAESANRASQPEWDGYTSPSLSYEVWRPLLRWTLADVIDIHRRHGLAPNPLYLQQGAQRVGCWPCFYAQKGEIRAIADSDPERIDLIRALETELTDRAGAPRALFWPRSIDEAVDWSRTSHGGRQYDLDLADPDEGCLRWGLCERATNEGEP
jgi:3'-phosphoadenosine 5'-phosphosulfate sulfotransferase (PAPS reductase)/FAD synthetase